VGLNHLNESVTDTFRWYFPRRALMYRFVNTALSWSALACFRFRNWFCGGKVCVNERIVEYPQVFRWIKPGGSVLDIGCAKARLPYHLASMGYDVHGLDPRSYPLTHPNLRVHSADLFDWEPGRTFDVVLLISTLEHFGLGRYGDIEMVDADFRAAQKITDWIAPGGQLIGSVPFGVGAVTSRHRIYDAERLSAVLSGYERVEEKYYRRIDGDWRPSGAQELKIVDSPTIPPDGVAVLSLRVA
jgi:SAM-dependent methyltransferase